MKRDFQKRPAPRDMQTYRGLGEQIADRIREYDARIEALLKKQDELVEQIRRLKLDNEKCKTQLRRSRDNERILREEYMI